MTARAPEGQAAGLRAAIKIATVEIRALRKLEEGAFQDRAWNTFELIKARRLGAEDVRAMCRRALRAATDGGR